MRTGWVSENGDLMIKLPVSRKELASAIGTRPETISRLIEKNDTLIPRAEAMAASNPAWCSCTYRSKPDHGKFATFARADAESSAILGGIALASSDWSKSPSLR